jgi:hypothetical protein
MYNPDIGHSKESPEIAISPDRKEVLDQFTLELHNKLGYGVTRVGDRLTIRGDRKGKSFDVEMVILEVKLKRDWVSEMEMNTPDGK